MKMNKILRVSYKKRNQYQKIFENNPHIFKCSVTFTKRCLLVWIFKGIGVYKGTSKLGRGL